MLEEKQLFTVLSNDDLEQISGGFNPVKYGKYVINEFVKGFRQAWQVVEVNEIKNRREHENTFQKIDIKDLAIVVGGSIYSSVGYGVGVVTHTVYDFGRGFVDGFRG